MKLSAIYMMVKVMIELEGKTYGARLSLTDADRKHYYERYVHFKEQGWNYTRIAERLGLPKFTLVGIVRTVLKGKRGR
jgi:hypothetical protein